GCDHALSCLEAAADLHPVALLPAGLHLALLVLPAAKSYEDSLLRARIHQGIGVHRDTGAPRSVQSDVHDHAREQIAARVVYFEPQLSGPALLIELRGNRRGVCGHWSHTFHADLGTPDD